MTRARGTGGVEPARGGGFRARLPAHGARLPVVFATREEAEGALQAAIDVGNAAFEAIRTGTSGSLVYYAQDVRSGFIKIGRTRNIYSRMYALDTASVSGVKLLCALPGGKAMESAMHRAFARHRANGEWFEAAEQLLEFIDELRAICPLTSQQLALAGKQNRRTSP